MSNDRSEPARAEALATIHAALDQGVCFLNTGDFYGTGHNEMLVGEAIRGVPRDQVILSVKFGALVGPNGEHYGLNVAPSTVKSYLAYSLERLGVDYVDLYQPCRINPARPVEETLGAVQELMAAGYVRHVGLSQVDAITLRRAAAVCPISLLEVNYSVFHRQPEEGLLQTAAELGIGVVAFGVLASGMLSSRSIEQMRASHPQYAPTDAEHHLAVVSALQTIADEMGITLTQLLTAWVLAQGPNIMALVGARTRTQLADSMGALNVSLSGDDLDQIDAVTVD